MGTSHSAKELAGKIERYAGSLDRTNERGNMAVARAVKDAVLVRIDQATGGDRLLSGMGNKGKMGVRYDKVRGASTSHSVVVRATGPMHLVERDVRPHWIAPKEGGRKRHARARQAAFINAMTGARISLVSKGVLRFSDGSFRRWAAKGGGSKGRHPFERGVEASRDDASKLWRAAHTSELARVFG